MTQNIILISAGKFSREVYCLVSDVIADGAPWRIKGFLDSRADLLDGFNYPVGIISSVEEYAPQSNDLFVCAIGDPLVRKHYSEEILEKGGQFATVVHPTAVVGRNVTLGTGAIINTFVTIAPDVTIGNFTHVGTNSVCSHDNRIGNWCQLSPFCCLAGNVTIEDLCFFGIHTAVVPGVRIGKQAFIGAGSVVLKNVQAGAKVFGNPAVAIE